MIIGESDMKNFRKAKKTIDVTVGESVRIIRELQGISQNKLADITGIPQSTISAIENVPPCGSCISRMGNQKRNSSIIWLL